MDKTQEKILELINTEGQAASDMTKAFKVIGNGDMKRGIKRFAKYFINVGSETGISVGEKRGMVKGSLVATGIFGIVLTGFYVKDKYDERKQKKEFEKDGQIILDAIEGTIRKGKEIEDDSFVSETTDKN